MRIVLSEQELTGLRLIRMNRRGIKHTRELLKITCRKRLNELKKVYVKHNE